MTRLTLALSLALSCTLAAPFSSAQAAPSTLSTIAPPSSGLLVSYSFWPEQFVQWVGDELPYSMLELDVDRTGKTPVYDAVLTERKTQKRVHYSNLESLVAAEKSHGGEAYKVEMAFDWDGTLAVGNTATLRFSLPDGKPLEWRFVQGSDLSEQGSGLTAIAEPPMPVLAYREQGAVAGDGTVLQIGGVASAAEMWKEISHPPYFVAYHGAMTAAAHRLVLLPGTEQWTVSSAPRALTAGSAWELENAAGAHRTVHIDKVAGAHFTFTGIDSNHPEVQFTLEATQAGTGWSVESVRYAPVVDGSRHALTLRFIPALASSASSSLVEFTAGKKTKFATASVTISGAPEDQVETITMKTPTWIQDKGLVEHTTWKDGKLETSAKLK